MNKKVLLQINSVVNTGSTGRIAEDLGQVVMQSGWDSFIAFGRKARTSQSNLIKIGSDWDVKMHGLQTRLFDRHGIASNSATNKLIHQVAKIKPDVIHLHNIHGYYINIEILFNYLEKSTTPIVWTLHDCWSFTGHCVYFDFVGCEKWQTQCNNCPQKKSYPASYFIDRSEKNFSSKKRLFSSLSNLTLVPVSQWLAKSLKKSYLRNNAIQIINNGINTSVFRPDKKPSVRGKYNIKNQFVVLGVANQWSQRKGLRDFIELGNVLDSNYLIILIGLTKKQIKILPSNIMGVEKTEHTNELAEYYSVANVFLNPTYEDNFPTTNLEALACGTPVITYNTGGSPEAIDKLTGIVVEKGDLNGLAKAIYQIKGKGKEYYTEACVNRAKQLFNKEDRYLDYLSLYESILSRQ